MTLMSDLLLLSFIFLAPDDSAETSDAIYWASFGSAILRSM